MRGHMRQKRLPVIVVICLMALLTGCETSRGLIKNLIPLEGSPHTFRNINYTATDELAVQLQKSLPGQIPMTAKALKQVPLAGSELPAGSPLPGLIMQQVSGRLVQHGYKVTTAYPAAAPAPVNPQNKDFTQVTLTGDYLMTNGDIVVHLEVVEEKTGRMLAAHDYTLPVTEEVRGYMGPNAVIPAEPSVTQPNNKVFGAGDPAPGNSAAMPLGASPSDGMMPAVPVAEPVNVVPLSKPVLSTPTAGTISSASTGNDAPLPQRKPAR